MSRALPVLGALAVNLLLFGLMVKMVEPRRVDLFEVRGLEHVEFVRPRQIERPVERRSRREAPPPPEASAEAVVQPMTEVQTSDVAVEAAPMPLGMPSVRLDIPLSAGTGAAVAPRVSAAPRGAGPDGQQPVLAGRLTRLSGLRPVYPAQARLRGIEGFVEIVFTVGPDGRVTHPRVVNSQPEGTFDEAAMSAILSWRFQPQLVDGKAVSVLAIQRFVFRIEGS